MPGKHVRFSRNTHFQSPPTPALSFSSISPASSYAPLTPPVIPNNYLPGPSPYTIGYAPIPKAPTIRVHPVLEYSSHQNVDFDILNHPSSITKNRRLLSSLVLSEPATSTPLRSMVITCPHLPWIITVYPQSGSHITVYDVFYEIYRSLHKSITSSDFASLPSDSARRASTRAYEQRYSRHRSSRHRDEEKRSGMLRIDFLMGMTRFAGLSPTGRGPDVWQLNIR
ncbi:hypothetical protein BDQ12DRAFT_629742 [Crucibulum laeve]|uniref:DUF6699 domain-containing protein n=1 Tax=Crucibulum laeve TaxID=68775 RepID=A0A5C3M349_9AGAR|nr:hypothetical protein BDQ12DRAFT_629742 [Crucibulum laeve]